MDTLLTREGLLAVSTSAAGVLTFIVAPYLPSLFPPAFARLVGFGTVCAALVPLWALSGDWQAPSFVGATSLGIMVVAHLWQTRRPVKEREDL